MKIKQMILMLFVFLSLIPLSVLGMTNMIYYNGKLEKLLENDLKVAVTTQVRSIDNFFNERRTEAAVLSNLESIKVQLREHRAGNVRINEDLDELLNLRVQTSGFLDRILVTDMDFRVVACSDSKLELDDDIKNLEQSYFQPQLQFTHVINDAEGEQKKYLAATQEITDEGKPIGYLILEVNLDFFEQIRTSAQLFNNGTVYIIDGTGQMIAAGDTVSSRGDYVLNEQERLDYKRAWNARDPKATTGILRYKARGEHYMSCYMELESLGWKVISSVNVDQVLGYRRSFMDLAAMILGTLVILLLFVNCLVRKYFAVPINDMIGKFNKIKATGNYGIRMDFDGENEIGVISREVNSLLESIEAHLDRQKDEQEKLRRRAEKDLMTGLYNKETMRGLMLMELESTKADHVPIACMFVDIDDFKDFNTRHGHIGGDQVLRFVAQTLETGFPGIAGRHGGDEFIVVVSGEENVERLENCINDVLYKLNQGVTLDDGEHITVRCSIGAAIVPDGDITYEELIARSDQAMYQIKHRRKNGYLILS